MPSDRSSITTLPRAADPSLLLADPESLQRRLAHFNHDRLAVGMSDDDWPEELRRDYEMRLLEGAFVESTRAEIAGRAASAPYDPDDFVSWFVELERNGPGQGDLLFPWLADHASRDEMRWFLEQEVGGEAGFEDLLAYTQVKMPTRAKLEMARNYWDEMGRGNAKGMHGPMLSHLAGHLCLQPQIDHVVWESLALANTMVALATNRRYAYQSVGALGVIELTAPGRAIYVSKGLRRLGVAGKQRHYFDLHAVLDVKHSGAWNAEVLHTLVAENPDAAPRIAEGALLRLYWGARCFDAYRRHLWRESAPAPSPEMPTASAA